MQCVVAYGNELRCCFVVAASRPISLPTQRLQGYSRTNLLIDTRSKPLLESDNVGVTESETLESSELSDCSLDISCSTVTQSASSPSEPDQENGTRLEGLVVTVPNAAEPENGEMLSDSSTVSAPSSSELEQENSSRQHLHHLAGNRPQRHGNLKKKLSVLKNVGATNCEILSGSAVCQPAVTSSMDTSNKEQIIIPASNRVQNYLASLGLPGVYALMCLDLK